MRSVILLSSLVLSAALQAQITVVNGASFRFDQPLAAGSWATAAAPPSSVPDTIAPAFPLPKTLGGVTLKIDGVDAPLYFVGGRPGYLQINFVVPNQIASGVHAVQVTSPAGTSTGTMRVITAAPGLFVKETANQQPPKGAVRNQDSIENTSSNPARRGEVISIYGTGPGAFTAPIEDGAATPASPLINTRSTPQVFIGGIAARVQFSGLSPGAPALWQINVFVPEQGFVSGRVPVQVFMDGVDSNEVTIFVSP